MDRIFLIGYMGSGKTSMGKLLATQLAYDFVDLDAYIETKYHKTVSQIFAEMGESKFREIERECLRLVGEFEKTIISTGGGSPCYFDNMNYMNAQGLTIYLRLTPEQLAIRLETSRAGKRPLLSNRKGEELRQYITEGLLTREPFYIQARVLLSGNDEEIIEKILNIKKI
jgi:shikimate kinase